MHGNASGFGDTLSPELALVCPELAERARASLPARPWEAFVPPRPPLRLGATAPARPQPAVVAPHAAVEPTHRRRPGRGSAVVGLLTVALVITGLLPARDAPTLRDATPPTEPSAGGATFVVEQGGDEPDDLVPPTRCLPAGATLGTPVAADGSFALVLPIGNAEVQLMGQVIEGRASGSYRVRSPGCDSGPVPFGAPPP